MTVRQTLPVILENASAVSTLKNQATIFYPSACVICFLFKDLYEPRDWVTNGLCKLIVYLILIHNSSYDCAKVENLFSRH